MNDGVLVMTAVTGRDVVGCNKGDKCSCFDKDQWDECVWHELNVLEKKINTKSTKSDYEDERKTEGQVTIYKLPNGHNLMCEDNGVGGHRYWSDEVGGGVCVWDTSLVDSSTLLAAIVEEDRFEKDEYDKKKRGQK